MDAPLGRPVEAANDVDQGALAGAVRTDDRSNFARVYRQIDIRQSLDAAKGEADAFQRQHLLNGSRHSRRGCCFVERDYVRIDRGVVTSRCHGRSCFSSHATAAPWEHSRREICLHSLPYPTFANGLLQFHSHLTFAYYYSDSTLSGACFYLSDYCCFSFPTARVFLMALSEMIGSLRCTSSPTLSISASTE